jgi:hypothetical protein
MNDKKEQIIKDLAKTNIEWLTRIGEEHGGEDSQQFCYSLASKIYELKQVVDNG